MSNFRACSTCKVEKPLLTGFHRDSTKKHGYSYQCKTCKEARKKITKNTPIGANMEAAKQKRANASRIARKRAYVRQLKESTACADCGRYGPYYCMDYDHTTSIKNFEIGFGTSSTGITLERLKAEIALCELVCAYCHRIRTHNQGYRRNV